MHVILPHLCDSKHRFDWRLLNQVLGRFYAWNVLEVNSDGASGDTPEGLKRNEKHLAKAGWFRNHSTRTRNHRAYVPKPSTLPEKRLAPRPESALLLFPQRP